MSNRFVVPVLVGILLLAGAMLFAGAASAANEDDYGRPGFYGTLLLATGTPTTYEGFARSLAPPLTDDGRSDTAVGVGGRLGWRALDRLAVEIQADWLDGFSYVVANDVHEIRGNTVVVTANARGYVLVDGRFQPFVLAGLGWIYNEPASSLVALPQVDGFGARIGAGFDSYFTRQLGMTLVVDYVVGPGAVYDLSHVGASIGLFFKF